ncbi:MAG: hypothetical protein KZQ58_00605 [gamma proteobacterium symbiont of Bathyaustriella thionipta]|nr:hypothetical protein [gamma proteobacterium symbiont of Bathyaustriella thionipta]
MPIRLFNLRNVPDDEVAEISQLLQAHDIDYYQTPAGNWGISSPALWLRQEAQKEKAEALLTQYQQQRQQQHRQMYEQRLQSGEQAGFIKTTLQNPFKLLLYLAVSVLILYLTLWPFLRLML